VCFYCCIDCFYIGEKEKKMCPFLVISGSDPKKKKVPPCLIKIFGIGLRS